MGYTLAGVGREAQCVCSLGKKGGLEVLVSLSEIRVRAEETEESLHPSNPKAAPRNRALSLPRGS